MNQNPSGAEAPDLRDGTLTETAVFDILSNERRRECIALLIQRSDEGTVSAWTISDAVATSLSEEDSPSRKLQHSVYVSLIQTHLPTLADHDVIEYAEADKSVSPGENLPLLETFLDIPASSLDSADADEVSAAEDDSAMAPEEPASTAEPTESYADLSAFDSRFVRSGYVLASLAVVVVLLVAVREPSTVPDVVRVAVVFLHLVAIGLIVGFDFPYSTTAFFE